MALSFLFDPNKQFQSIGGVNEVSGFLRVFLNCTDDRATTFKNFDGTLNEADIVLDTYGRAVVIVDDTKTYRLEVYNRLGGLMWTVSNYKASGGSGGGSGTPVSVEGTVGEIDVDENTEGGVKHFVVGLAATIKNAIATLTMAVNGVANALNGKKDKQTPVNGSGSTTKTLVDITQNENGEISLEFDDIAFPDWTSAITAATDLCEKLANKKTTFSGFETSDTYYPTLKAVVDYLDGRLQNLGGKKITNNGQPFTAASQLPTTTPYYGQNINSDDYSYVQDTGLASRYTAVVTGSSVSWSLDYEIAIPVFTAEQQAAIDSGANSTKIGNYDSHLANTNNPHGVTYSQVGASPDTHTHQVVINGVTKTIDKTGGTPVDLGTYLTSHQDLSGYLSKTGDGSDVTASFSTAGSRNNISTGEKLSVIFGKIAKWFADLKTVAFTGSYSDLSGTPTIPEAATATPQAVSSSAGSAGSSDYFAKGDHVHKIVVSEGVNNGQVSIAGQSVSVKGWSTKQDTLPTNITPVDTYAINVSGSADHALKSKIAYGSTSSSAASVTKSVSLANNIDYSERDFLIAVTFVNGNTHENYINISFDNVSYTVTDNRVKWIRAGETYLFKLNTATTSDGKLVGDLNTVASLEANARGTTYTLTDNRGIPHTVDAYPYQSPTGVVDTFRYNTQSFTNGTGSSLTKILMLNESGGKTLNWAQYVESRFDFIDMTIRVCGFYNSTNASAEVITVEPYKYSGSYISAGLPELSSYILLLNDGVTHPFTFTVHLRMSYKEFLSSIGGTGTTLNLGFTFGASTSSSNKHSITFANVWTRVTYHGDRS